MKENKQIEFKVDISNSFLKTVSAFSNYAGGTIIFGIDNNGKIVGIKNINDTCLQIENMINDTITPQPEYEIFVNHSNKTISLKIKSGNRKPYLYKSKAYKRNDTATIEVDNIELKRLILEGDNLDFEELTSNNQDLSFSYLEKELQEKIGIQSLDNNILKTLNLYSEGNGFNNAAVILSDNNVFSGIDLAKFGRTISIFQKRLISESKSILESYNDALGMYKDYYQYEIVEGASRKKVELIPEEAFREAIANAIVHRLWDIKSNIRVSMFDSYIEIVSPGGLTNGISEENYLEGQISVLRNPILASVLHRLNMIEKFGTGIRRIKESYSNSKSKPEFKITDNTIQVTLPIFIENSNLTDDEMVIYNVLNKFTFKSISEIMSIDTISFGKSKVTDLLKKMENKGAVVIEGQGKATKYKAR